MVTSPARLGDGSLCASVFYPVDPTTPQRHMCSSSASRTTVHIAETVPFVQHAKEFRLLGRDPAREDAFPAPTAFTPVTLSNLLSAELSTPICSEDAGGVALQEFNTLEPSVRTLRVKPEDAMGTTGYR